MPFRRPIAAIVTNTVAPTIRQKRRPRVLPLVVPRPPSPRQPKQPRPRRRPRQRNPSNPLQGIAPGQGNLGPGVAYWSVTAGFARDTRSSPPRNRARSDRALAPANSPLIAYRPRHPTAGRYDEASPGSRAFSKDFSSIGFTKCISKPAARPAATSPSRP